MKEFKFNLKNGSNVKMKFDEFVRWACLLEGVEYISTACEERGMNINDDSWIKPLALQKYIEERFPAMQHDLKVEAIMGNI